MAASKAGKTMDAPRFSEDALMSTPALTARPLALPLAPASFFAMTLGLAETGNAWRLATSVWDLPPLAGEALQLAAVLSFAWWLALYVNKWVRHRDAAIAEARDPVQSAFLALIPESVILVALALHPYDDGAARLLFWVGSAANIAYGAFRLSRLWTQEHQPAQIAPPLFLTFTASILVNALVAGLFGYTQYGWMLFGIGAVSWLVMDSTIAQQLATGGLAARTRNFMGIYMAPSVVALAACQVLGGGETSPALSLALTGYALFLTLALAMAWRWLREQAFAAGYWAYTFGVATLAQGLLLMVERTHDPVLNVVAAAVFAVSLLLTASVAIGTLRLFARGTYYPPKPA
jgi:tellurite resistance protein